MELRDDPRLRHILDSAADLPPARRAAYLDSACAGDTLLRIEVERLLVDLERAGQFLKDPTIEPPSTNRAPTTLSAALTGIGSHVGPYKLLQKIGEGGMGIVYMAEQEHPVQRKVAFKIIKAGMDTKQVVARFEAERQALAIMEHPNIARILDAGETQTGRPYFVMELVRGIPLTKYCDANNLTTKQRLQLFIPICRAVQHAHQKGIIHRDLKPSNVLVTLHDGVPVPKIIDFGIAKATGKRLTDKTLFTEYQQFLGTPEYMSPEQAEMSGLDVDTRADVYALGVMLYELLTGTTPIEATTLRQAAYGEMQRIIRDIEPPLPSTRINQLDEKTVTDLASHRGIDPQKLKRLVRGELDWIVMKCLEKDRSHRYETASNLANDLSRHLNDEPVEASPPSAFYRLKKLYRRRRLPLQVAAAFALLLMVSIALGIIGIAIHVRDLHAEQQRTLDALRDAQNQRDEAERRRQEAEQQKAIAQSRFNDVHELSKSLFSVADQLGSIPRSEPARANLVKTSLAYLNKLVADAGTDEALEKELADGYGRVAEIQSSLDDEPGKEKSEQARFDIIKRLYDAHPDDLDRQKDMAWAYDSLGYSKGFWGNGPGAIELMEKSDEIWKPLLQKHPNDEKILTGAYFNTWRLGWAWSSKGDTGKALECFRRSEKIMQVVVDATKNSSWRTTLFDIRRAISQMEIPPGDNAAQIGFRRQELVTAQKRYQANPNDPQARDHLAWSLMMLGKALRPVDSTEARADFQQAMPLFQAEFDADPVNSGSRWDWATINSEMGDSLVDDKGDWAASLVYYQMALPIWKRVVADGQGDESFMLVNTYERMGTACGHTGDKAGAIQNLRSAEMIRLGLKDENPDTAQGQVNLSTLYGKLADRMVELNDQDGALSYFDKRIAVAQQLCKTAPEQGNALLADLQKQFAGNPQLHAAVISRLVETYRSLGRNDDAQTLLVSTRPAATQP